MLGFSYGEIFLSLGATAALIGWVMLFLHLIIIWNYIICSWNVNYILGKWICNRAKGFTNHMQNSRKASWSSYWMCTIGSWSVWHCYAAISSSPGIPFLQPTLYIYNSASQELVSLGFFRLYLFFFDWHEFPYLQFFKWKGNCFPVNIH